MTIGSTAGGANPRHLELEQENAQLRAQLAQKESKIAALNAEKAQLSQNLRALCDEVWSLQILTSQLREDLSQARTVFAAIGIGVVLAGASSR